LLQGVPGVLPDVRVRHDAVQITPMSRLPPPVGSVTRETGVPDALICISVANAPPARPAKRRPMAMGKETVSMRAASNALITPGLL
jgi:hypothetical protein